MCDKIDAMKIPNDFINKILLTMKTKNFKIPFTEIIVKLNSIFTLICILIIKIMYINNVKELLSMKNTRNLVKIKFLYTD